MDQSTFHYRAKDIGKPKAVVAADFINKRVPSCKVTAYPFLKKKKVLVTHLIKNLESAIYIIQLLFQDNFFNSHVDCYH